MPKPTFKKPLPKDFVRYESCWDLGAKAARDGLEASDCPYESTSYDFVTWMNGWTFAAHMMAKEAEEKPKKGKFKLKSRT